MKTGRRRSTPSAFEEHRPVWGVRVAPELKEACQLASALLRIPNYLLVSFILESWLYRNRALLESKEGRERLATSVAIYSATETDGSPAAVSGTTSAKTGDLLKTRDVWSVRGVSVETIARIHVLALVRGIPMYQLIDDIVAGEWEKTRDEPIKPGGSGKIRKKISHILRRSVRSAQPEETEAVDDALLRKVIARIARQGRARGIGH
jgi:hypothetical protein